MFCVRRDRVRSQDTFLHWNHRACWHHSAIRYFIYELSYPIQQRRTKSCQVFRDRYENGRSDLKYWNLSPRILEFRNWSICKLCHGATTFNWTQARFWPGIFRKLSEHLENQRNQGIDFVLQTPTSTVK